MFDFRMSASSLSLFHSSVSAAAMAAVLLDAATLREQSGGIRGGPSVEGFVPLDYSFARAVNRGLRH